MNASIESVKSSRAEPLANTGHYADKHRRASFLRWSHGARFVKARELVQPLAGAKLLDYGCGDGAFMSLVVDLFPDATGADTAEEQILDCRMRLGAATTQRFLTCDELVDVAWSRTFDVATCMEVLEHCRDSVVDRVLDDLCRLVKPGGAVIISVPIEVGPTLAFKQMLRRVAGWKGISDYSYTERYRPAEFMKMVLANENTDFDRPVYGASSPLENSGYHGHKGFNWRRLETILSQRMTIDKVAFTPLSWTRSLLNSQVWFVCRTAA